jgi:MFS family permease
MGSIVDRWHVTTCILITTIGATLSAFLFWGFASHLALLLVFCFIYGLFAGCYTTTYPGVMKLISEKQEVADTTLIFSVLVAGRGIGNVLSGPISEALIGAGELGKVGVYGSEYGPLVIFTGVSMALGGISFIGRGMRWY